MLIKIKKVQGFEDIQVRYMTNGAAGFDLCAAVSSDVVLSPSEYKAIETGICIQIPAGYEGQVRPRSGLALNHGITLLNSPGTIDSDYRGEIKAILVNLSNEDFVIHRGDRIAQIVFAKVENPLIEIVDELETTKRGKGGFGSTGI